MKLGKKVITRKLGLPVIGEVCGFMTAAAYIVAVSERNVNFKLWDKYYPKWRQGYIIFVMFDEAVPVYSLKEVRYYYPDMSAEECAKLTPTSRVVYLPQDDLESFE